jgi:fatty acid/phospholipid biosynthesis enzyme
LFISDGFSGNIFPALKTESLLKNIFHSLKSISYFL